MFGKRRSVAGQDVKDGVKIRTMLKDLLEQFATTWRPIGEKGWRRLEEAAMVIEKEAKLKHLLISSHRVPVREIHHLHEKAHFRRFSPLQKAGKFQERFLSSCMVQKRLPSEKWR